MINLRDYKFELPWLLLLLVLYVLTPSRVSAAADWPWDEEVADGPCPPIDFGECPTFE